MNIFHRNDRRIIKIYWFFIVLIAIKIVYFICKASLSYNAWSDDGLFLYNSKLHFVFTNIVSGLFGLIPYVLFGVLMASKSRKIYLAFMVGIFVMGSDLFSDFYFQNSTDAQTGISIVLLYLSLLFVVFIIFTALNFYLERISINSRME